MKSKTIYIYPGDEKTNTFTGEFKIKAFGEFMLFGQSIQAYKDGSNIDKVETVLKQRMFMSLAVMDYVVRNKIERKSILDDQGKIIEEVALKILENVPRKTDYPILFHKPE